MPEPIYGKPPTTRLPTYEPIGGLAHSLYPYQELVYGQPTGRARYEREILRTPGLIDFWTMREVALPYKDWAGSFDLTTGLATNQPTGLVPSDPDHASRWTGATTAQSATNFTVPSQISLEVWVTWDNFAPLINAGIAGCWSGGVGFMFFNGTVLGPEIRWYTGNGSLLGPTPILNKVYHLVGTFDGTDRRMYVDGALVAGPTAGLALASPGLPVQVGGYSGAAGLWLGVIDRVSIYNRPLTDLEVWAHWQAAQR